MAGIIVDKSKIAGFRKMTAVNFDSLWEGNDALAEVDLVKPVMLQTGDFVTILEDCKNEKGECYTDLFKGKPVINVMVEITDSRQRHVGYQMVNASMFASYPSVNYKDHRLHSPITEIVLPDDEGNLKPIAVNSNKQLYLALKAGVKFRVTRVFNEWEDESREKRPARKYQWAQVI